jgi:arsenate reductase
MNILILCTGNSCRSQIAEGYFRYFFGKRANIYSAGVEVHGVNPNAVQTMLADGIDISSQTSNNISEYSDIHFDYVLTVCDNAQERCPVFVGRAERLHHNFADPAKAVGTAAEIAAAFALVRDQIKTYIANIATKWERLKNI